MKKILFLSLMSLTIIGLMGCGKKNNSISENLINDNPGEIVVDESLLISQNNTTNEYEGIISGSDFSSEDGMIPLSNDDSASDNSISDNIVSTNETENETEEIKETPMTYDAYVAANSMANKPLTICNTSGKNIDKLYISFSVANMSNIEILGSSTLMDGTSFEYDILDKEALKTSNKISLSIIAESGNSSIDFGLIDIVDPSDMVIVLGKNNTGYCLYLE